MAWSELPKGSFTGIDWGQPHATAGFDPYLVWAEADGFSGYGGMPEDGWLPVAIELHPGHTIQQFIDAGSSGWLHVPPIYATDTVSAAFRFCTARVRPQFFAQLQPKGSLHSIVKRVELGLPAGNNVRPPAQAAASPSGANASIGSEEKLAGKVLGLIDDSLALAHANFLADSGLPRIAWFWRQDADGIGAAPAALGYGHELRATRIHDAMVQNTKDGVCDEGGVYVDLGLSTLGKIDASGRVRFHALDTAVSHGTLVLDLAAGPRALPARVANLPPGFDAPPSWLETNGAATECPIVAVQLDYETVRDTSGGSMNVGILDALLYILSRCAPQAEVVVNISFGTLAGPHDGSSLLEAAMDELIAQLKGRLSIVLAAGNGYQSRTHANIPLTASNKPPFPWQREATLQWVIQPDDETQSFLELWLPEGATGVTLQVTPPGHPASAPFSFGQSRIWTTDGSSQPSCAVIYPQRVATGDNGTCVLIALAPTSVDADQAAAPSGCWKVKLSNTGDDAVVDAYIERDDIVSGTGGGGGGRQSHFDDDLYNLGDEVDDPANASLIRRSGSFNSIATGTKTVSVGATRMTYRKGQPMTGDSQWALYSPRYPDPDVGRPLRDGVVKVPNKEGFGDESAALEGVTGAGTRSGAVVRLKGTSAAAPQVARKLLGWGGATNGPEAS